MTLTNTVRILSREMSTQECFCVEKNYLGFRFGDQDREPTLFQLNMELFVYQATAILRKGKWTHTVHTFEKEKEDGHTVHTF